MIISNTQHDTDALVITFYDETGFVCNRDKAVKYRSNTVDIIAWSINPSEETSDSTPTPWPIAATTFYSELYVRHPNGMIEAQHDSLYEDEDGLFKELDELLERNAKRLCDEPENWPGYASLDKINEMYALNLPEKMLSVAGKVVKAWYKNEVGYEPRTIKTFINGERRPVCTYEKKYWPEIAKVASQFIGHSSAQGYPNEHAVY